MQWDMQSLLLRDGVTPALKIALVYTSVFSVVTHDSVKYTFWNVKYKFLDHFWSSLGEYAQELSDCVANKLVVN